MPLAFAYSTINWGETPDLPAVLRAIAEAGWRAVELFGHSLDWLGPHTLVRDATVGASITQRRSERPPMGSSERGAKGSGRRPRTNGLGWLDGLKSWPCMEPTAA
jgi:hypothetical protein